MKNLVFDALGADGALAKLIPEFRVRHVQQDMAVLVDKALKAHSTLVVEAGTGTGKTFAYLVPSLLSGKRVIISTGTKTLQDQLFHRDLPLVRKALGVPIQTALLKGRSNYLCRYRLSNTRQDGQNLPPARIHEIEEIYSWSLRTTTGDFAELNQLPETSPVWPMVTSTTENCLGQHCDDYQECFVLKARRAAQGANLLVINHHLLMADLVLKDIGFGELLPGADAFVIDEAHQLAEIAGHFLGISLSSRQLRQWLEDLESALLNASNKLDYPAIVTNQLNPIRVALAAVAQLMPGQGRHDALPWLAKPRAQETLNKLIETISLAVELIRKHAAISKEMENCCARGLLYHERLQRIMSVTSAAQALAREVVPVDEPKNLDHQAQVMWLEIDTHGFAWHMVPIDIASQYQEKCAGMDAAWIYTSATLAVGKSFEHFSQRLGLKADESVCFESPFDYPQQALLYIPSDLPEPNSEEFTAGVAELIRELLQECPGGMFGLFTSHRALQNAAQRLRNRIQRPLLVQGEAPRADLLDRFRKAGNALLLGSSSFWEGVDVRGPALSCVVIDRLPFASPGDPLVQARIDYYRRQQLNPFNSFQLPQAVISLKQGVGRLIRDEHDRGVMVICDTRLLTKPYGKLFLRSLPPMRRVKSKTEVMEFFNSIAETPTVTS